MEVRGCIIGMRRVRGLDVQGQRHIERRGTLVGFSLECPNHVGIRTTKCYVCVGLRLYVSGP